MKNCTTLKNGTTLLTKKSSTNNILISLFIKTGSRYETKKSAGYSHLIEHLFLNHVNFKNVRKDGYTAKEMLRLNFFCKSDDMDIFNLKNNNQNNLCKNILDQNNNQNILNNNNNNQKIMETNILDNSIMETNILNKNKNNQNIVETNNNDNILKRILNVLHNPPTFITKKAVEKEIPIILKERENFKNEALIDKAHLKVLRNGLRLPILGFKGNIKNFDADKVIKFYCRRVLVKNVVVYVESVYDHESVVKLFDQVFIKNEGGLKNETIERKMGGKLFDQGFIKNECELKNGLKVGRKLFDQVFNPNNVELKNGLKMDDKLSDQFSNTNRIELKNKIEGGKSFDQGLNTNRIELKNGIKAQRVGGFKNYTFILNFLIEQIFKNKNIQSKYFPYKNEGVFIFERPNKSEVKITERDLERAKNELIKKINAREMSKNDWLDDCVYSYMHFGRKIDYEDIKMRIEGVELKEVNDAVKMFY